MQVVSIISTKGGVGKTTVAANLGAFIADAGLRVLLLDLDMQPTLSSYYELKHRAPGGIYELLAFNERDLANLVSRTVIDNLDLVLSNDEHRQLNTLLRSGGHRHPGRAQRIAGNGTAGIPAGRVARHTGNPGCTRTAAWNPAIGRGHHAVPKAGH